MSDNAKLAECVKRVDVLISGVRQMIDERHDQPDLERHQCACGSSTLFSFCPVCAMAALRKEKGLS